MQSVSAKEYADGLRQIADFIEAHPDMERPSETVWVFIYDREPFVRSVLELSKGGSVEKSVDRAEDGHYKARRQFGALNLEFNIPRKTFCRLVTPAVYECPDSLLEVAAEYAGAAA